MVRQILVDTESEGRLARVSRPVPVLVQVLPQDSETEPRQWSVSDTIEIGRGVDAERGICFVDDKRLSKKHALIELRNQQVTVRDLGSKNHTFVNGKQVETSALRDGDILRTGGALFVLRYQVTDGRDAEPGSTAISSRLLGHSTTMRRVRRELSQVARSGAPVLLIAPTGSGKELAAEAIHDQSGRRKDALVRVNCAGITSTLSESELFGHERDAFSGARRTHKGFFAQADGGTLFLDEVGDMPPDLQPKLLRVLQPIQPPPMGGDGRTPYRIRIRPVGGEQDVELDVRIIAATNVDMAQSVSDGGFRADLYQRLQSLIVRLPPLSERREDILWLLHHYLNNGTGPSKTWRSVTARLGELLVLYSWPGNVRELIAMTQRLTVFSAGAALLDLDALPHDVLAQIQQTARPAESSDGDASTPQRITRELLERLLAENQGNISKIARLLTRSPRQIRRRLQEFGLLKGTVDDEVIPPGGKMGIGHRSDFEEDNE